MFISCSFNRELVYDVQFTDEYINATPFIQDFLFYCALLEDTHPNTEYFKTGEWTDRKMQAREKVESCKTKDELAAIIQSLSASMDDAHTSCRKNFYEKNKFNSNITVSWFGNELRIVNAIKPLGNLVGKKIDAINNVNVDTLVYRASKCFGGENTITWQRNLIWVLNSKFTPELNIGGIRYITCNGETFDLIDNPSHEWANLRVEFHPVTAVQKGMLHVQYLDNIAYMQLNSMQCDLEWINRAFDDFFINTEKLNIHNIVLDLRNNGGGDSRVGYIFLKKLNVSELEKNFKVEERDSRLSQYHASSAVRQIDFKPTEYKTQHKKNVYFIQGRNTYSAAADLVVAVCDNNLYLTVGEPTGQKPCCYGDILSFELPNTQIEVGVSYKYFYRPDTTKCHEDSVYPNVYIPHTYEDYITGEDPCWEWILTDINKKR